MFQIGFSELMLVLLIAFVIVGPKDLPKVARWLGRTLKKLRRMMADLKSEMGLDELENEAKGIQQEIKDAKQELDVTQPIRQAEAALKDSIRDVRETVSSHQDSKKKEERTMRLGTTEIILIVVLALVLFGGGKLAGVGKALGKSIKDFKKKSRTIQQTVRVRRIKCEQEEGRDHHRYSRDFDGTLAGASSGDSDLCLCTGGCFFLVYMLAVDRLMIWIVQPIQQRGIEIIYSALSEALVTNSR